MLLAVLVLDSNALVSDLRDYPVYSGLERTQPATVVLKPRGLSVRHQGRDERNLAVGCRKVLPPELSGVELASALDGGRHRIQVDVGRKQACRRRDEVVDLFARDHLHPPALHRRDDRVLRIRAWESDDVIACSIRRDVLLLPLTVNEKGVQAAV